ncbi:MAG: hypothetical protein R3B13_41505 [Polyangiaceae bacterium]
MIAEADRLPVLSSTKHRDYILTPYEPPVPALGGLHPASLLKHLMRYEGLDAWPVVEALRAHLGPDETVWGAKWGPSGFAVEFYFYNFVDNAAGNPAAATALAQALGGVLRFDHPVDERLPYFMCSFEVSRALLEAQRGSDFRVYLRSGDKHRRECGFSYRCAARGELVLENHYWFYFAKKEPELEDAVRRVQASPRSGARGCWAQLLPKQLRDCFTICYAVKPHWDGLYYSRVSAAQLLPFLRAHGRDHVAEVLAAHERDFAHALWDLGFDFAAPPGAQGLRIEKLALHGVV